MCTFTINYVHLRRHYGGMQWSHNRKARLHGPFVQQNVYSYVNHTVHCERFIYHLNSVLFLLISSWGEKYPNFIMTGKWKKIKLHYIIIDCITQNLLPGEIQDYLSSSDYATSYFLNSKLEYLKDTELIIVLQHNCEINCVFVCYFIKIRRIHWWILYSFFRNRKVNLGKIFFFWFLMLIK